MEPDMRAIKAAAKAAFSEVSGVEGFGIGDQSLRVYVSNSDVSRELPREFQGVEVECVVTGDISAQPGSGHRW